MKAKQTISKWLIVSATLLVLIPGGLDGQSGTSSTQLSLECSGHTLTLKWDGRPGLILQRSTNLAAGSWQDVPGSESMSNFTCTMNQTQEFFRLKDLGNVSNDPDGDGLDGNIETVGWQIWVDTSGYADPGSLELRAVTCDPTLRDTDFDNLSDLLEWFLGTDPRSSDTDRDGLTDGDEWFRWHTSPTSVDSDGDARGSSKTLPPRSQLFDGNELSLLHTSPTLEDTDGDGRTDCDEYDQVGRSPLIAEVPRLGVELVDALDVRLDVEYAEESGMEHQYGGELSISDSTANRYTTQTSLNWSVTVGAAATVGLTDASVTASTEVSVGGDVSVGFETESSHSVERSHSDYQTDSRTRTETAASGSMSGGIRLVNTSPVSFTISDLGMTVRYLQPRKGTEAEPSFQTLATLVPTLGSGGITLAPGDRTPVLHVEAAGLNASRVKQFMARPNSLYLEPAFYELENAQGLNFDYLEEVTRWRTARVQIDFGNGESEEYRVATNVERHDDGSYAGITLGKVMSDILQIPFQTVARQGGLTHEQVLNSVRTVTSTDPAKAFWAVVMSGDVKSQSNVDFQDIVIQAGDRVLLVFVQDEDADGLFSTEEQHYRTDALASNDSDGDGLEDEFEVRAGWEVVLPGRTYHVFSDPAQADQDGDGLTDQNEWSESDPTRRTDPAKADTDDDGIPDNLDLFPLVPAKVLRVKADAPAGGDGSRWETALNNLQTALARARDGLASSTDSTDDVAEIWVAAGEYKPTTTDPNTRRARFDLVDNTALYGGFNGVETKLSQRNPDPLTNGTILSGDLAGDDASTYAEGPASFGENSYHVCRAAADVGPGSRLDGFLISGGNSVGDPDDTDNGGGLRTFGTPQLGNLAFRANHAVAGAGLDYSPSTGGELQVSDSLFLQNDANDGAGIHSIPSPANCRLVLRNCQFVQNTVASMGGAVHVGGADGTTFGVAIIDCTFNQNTAGSLGGAVYSASNAALRIAQGQFLDNAAGYGGAIATTLSTGHHTTVEIVQSVFFKNRATTPSDGDGGAIRIGSASSTVSLYVINSGFTQNSAPGAGSAIEVLHNNSSTTTVIDNSIIWDNPDTSSSPFNELRLGTRARVRNSCFNPAHVDNYSGTGNLNADPKFVDGANGNLRLQSGSPCLDRGNSYVDYYPTTPGFQLLPETDLDGNLRIVDGNGDGTATVDMGAYER